MSNKIQLIIAREYLAKIKSRTFILLTILGPLIYILLIFGSVLLAKFTKNTDVLLTISDQSGLFEKEFIPHDKYQAVARDLDASAIEDYYKDTTREGEVTLFIPADIAKTKRGVKLYYSENPGLSLERDLRATLTHKLRDLELKKAGIDKDVSSRIQKLSVGMEIRAIGESGSKKGNMKIATGLAYVTSYLLYIFIFIYGSMVLRGVQEEKTSRIAEVLISSVKPFELMMGKIIGNALLGFTQFAIWIVMVIAGTTIAGSVMGFGGAGDAEAIAAAQSSPVDQSAIQEIMQSVMEANLWEISFFLVIFFLFGYLLYSSMFAAVAAAVDGQQDLQQFMLPISMPLILAAVVILPTVVDNPTNGVAVFFSLFPLTSPIVMMARIPFEVVWWQKLLSVVILIVTFIGSVYVSGKIYRIGLLNYGAKPSWKQMFKWLKFKG